MKFRMEIEMENAAMQDGSDIAYALNWTARQLDGVTRSQLRGAGTRGTEIPVADRNGNAVGKAWIVGARARRNPVRRRRSR